MDAQAITLTPGVSECSIGSNDVRPPRAAPSKRPRVLQDPPGRFREDSEDEMPEGKLLQRMSEKFRLPQSVQRLVFTVTIDREPEKLKLSAGDRLSDIAAAVLQVKGAGSIHEHCWHMNPGTREGSPPSAVLGGMPDDNAHANSLFAHLGVRRAGEKFSLVYDYGDTHHIVMEVVKVENVNLGEQLCEVLIIEPEAQSEPALPEGQVSFDKAFPKVAELCTRSGSDNGIEVGRGCCSIKDPYGWWMQALGGDIVARGMIAFESIDEFWVAMESLMEYKHRDGDYDYRTGYMYPSSYPKSDYVNHDSRSWGLSSDGFSSPMKPCTTYFDHAVEDPAEAIAERGFVFSEVFPKITAKLQSKSRVAYWLDFKGGVLRLVKGKCKPYPRQGTESSLWKAERRYKSMHSALVDCEKAIK